MTGFRAARWAGLALTAWALDFAAMYAWVPFACPAAGARPGHDGGGRSRRAGGAGRPLGRDVARFIALLSLIAILWLAVAVLSPPTCGPAA